jgi:hypothetical protein
MIGFQMTRQPPYDPQPHDEPRPYEEPPTPYPGSLLQPGVQFPPLQQTQYPLPARPRRQIPQRSLQPQSPAKRHRPHRPPVRQQSQKAGLLERSIILAVVIIVLAIMVALIGKQNVTTYTSIFDTSPTNDILPTAAPTPTRYLSSRDIERSSLLLAQHSGAVESYLSSYYDPGSGSLTITETIAPTEIGARTVLTNCFYIEKAIWQGKIPNLKTVTVNIIVPVGNDVTSTLAICTLNKSTEQRFDWDTLNPGLVWEAYDYTWILPGLIQ